MKLRSHDSLPAMQARGIGASLLALAIYFNLPYLRLSATFDYPAILRQSPTAILAAFQGGGVGLVLTWYAFALAAILFVPVSMAHAMTSDRLHRFPALAISAAILGALAGILQAMGLLRWVMVVPELASLPGGEAGFALIHAYAGVALGEHLGMLLTAGHVAAIAVIQFREDRMAISGLGSLSALAISLGAMEGVALAVNVSGTAFGLGAILGYLLLTLWMVVSGIGLFRGR